MMLTLLLIESNEKDSNMVGRSAEVREKARSSTTSWN